MLCKCKAVPAHERKWFSRLEYKDQQINFKVVLITK